MEKRIERMLLAAVVSVVTAAGAGATCSNTIYSCMARDSNGFLTFPIAANTKYVRKGEACPTDVQGYNGVLFERGGSWTCNSSILVGNNSATATLPYVVGAFGSGPRPILNNCGSNLIVPRKPNHLAIVGLELRRTCLTAQSHGIFFAGSTSSTYDDWVIEDNRIVKFYDNIAIENGHFKNLVIRRNILIDSIYTTNNLDTSFENRPEAMYIEGAENGLIEDNVLDNNGGGPNTASVLSHQIYWSYNSPNATMRNNIVSNGPDAVQFRKGATMEDNLFYNNAISAMIWCADSPGVQHLPASDCKGVVKNNVVLNGHDLGGSSGGRGWGIEVGDGTSGKSTPTGPAVAEVTGNIIAHTLTSNGFALALKGSYMTSATLSNNRIYDWSGGILAEIGSIPVTMSGNQVQRFITTGGSTALRLFRTANTGTRISGSNDLYYSPQATSFNRGSSGLTYGQWTAYYPESGSSGFAKGPTVTANLGDYYNSINSTSLSQSEAAAAFIARARQRPSGVWEPAYTASAANQYLRVKFGLAKAPVDPGDTQAPTLAIASPAAGATLSGTASVSGTAADNVGVTSVQVSVDGGAYAAASGTGNWSYSLNTANLVNGAHSITARASDAAGNLKTASVSFSVYNAIPQTNPPPALAALYTLNEAAGTTSILDSSGFGNTGFLGTGASAPSRVTGSIGSGLGFNGAATVATVPNSGSLGGLASFSYVAWIYPTSWGGSGFGRIISRESAGFDDNYFCLSGANTTLAFSMGSTVYNAVGPVGAIKLKKWQHVAVSYDGVSRTVKLFLNGAELRQTASIPATSPMVERSSHSISIGNRAALDRGFAGTIDGVRVYNGALAAAQVAALYAEDQPLLNPVDSTATRIGSRLTPLVYLRAQGAAPGRAPTGQQKALMLHLEGSRGQSLVFAPEVTEVALVGLSGQTYLRQSSLGGAIEIPLNASSPIPSGYSVLRVNRNGLWDAVGVVRVR